ncbi:MAG: glutathione-disulfide reductase [Pseudomonadota bacterium]|nr:glutathione-disulfide reductase [Pseudomonadota bacterium]
MAEFDYDMFVIGIGSGGVRAARFAANFGAKIAAAEDRYMGGTCVNVGCIPKKLFVYASHFPHDFEDAAAYGWTVGEASFDWTTLRDNKDKEIGRLNGIYENMLGNAGVEVFKARATVVDPHTVDVGGKQVTAKYILIATGGWPSVPDIPGKEHAITSNEFFHMEKWPERAIVVGGGYIAVELTGVFHGLGTNVIQLYRGPHFLRGFDDDVRHHLADEMRKQKVDLRFNANIARIEKDGDELVADLEDGTQMRTDVILYATGRSPNSANIGLEAAGVELGKGGAVLVDEGFKTSVPSIYAIGDVIDRVQLTPVALEEGMVVANELFNEKVGAVDYTNIPTAVFSQPSIGTVGLTEAQARDKYGKVDIYMSDFKALKHTLTGRDERTLMKMIVHPETDAVLGVHMVGPEAGEIVQGIGIALKAGATKATFDATIGIHPTSAEEFVTMREKVPDEDRRAAE